MTKMSAIFSSIILFTALPIYADQYIPPQEKLYGAVISYWNTDLLTHDESQVTQFIRNLDWDLRRFGVPAESFFKKVSDRLESRIAYHQKHIGKKWDPNGALFGGCALAVGLIGARILHYCYTHWHRPIRNQIAEYYTKYNISTEYRSFGRNTEILISGAGQDTAHLVSLLSSNDTYWQVELIAAGLLTLPLLGGIFLLPESLLKDPQHQLHYEKLTLFKKNFDSRIFQN